MPRRPERLILIHGAWAGPWVWDALVPALAARGWPAEALALPGDGHHPIRPQVATEADFHDCLAGAIHRQPGPVALVGHSGGGMLVTAGAAAHPGKVSHGVWIAGMLIPDGRTFDDVQREASGSGIPQGITPFIQPSADGLVSTVPPDAAMAHFFQDAAPDIAAASAAKLTPQPVSGHRIRTAAKPSFDDLPKLYILAERDRSVLPDVQALMARSARRVTCKPIGTGHVPQMIQPDATARIISDWLGTGED